MINIAINGFGRIGRSIMRLALHDEMFNIVALNDISDWNILDYLLLHDSTHRALDIPFRRDGDNLIFPTSHNLSPIATLNVAKEPHFGAYNADIVFESSGMFLSTESISYHLKNGVKKVILSAPPSDNMPMFVLGVNESAYDGEAIVSNASCTANAIAPFCDILHNAFGIQKASVAITHSYTNEQSLLDNVYPNDKRRSRAAAQNIIPTHTGAINAISRVLPHLSNRLLGHSVRVPVANVLLLDMTFYFEREVSTESLNALIIAKSQNELKGIIGIDDTQGVSSDFIGDMHSAVFVPDLSMANGNMCKIMAWSDNEYSYTKRLLDLARFIWQKR